MDVSNTSVLITGGAGGIGAAMARRFHAEGARMVFVADVDLEGAQRVAESIRGIACELDVTDEAATAALLGTIESDHGGLDILCCNAGIATGGSVDAPNESWEHTWQVNVMAHVYATRHALPPMLERGRGYIVSTASAAGLLTNIGAAPYSVTKHGAVALAEWIAVTYGDRGIGVSCLCPQFVDTAMLDAFGDDAGPMREWVTDLAISPDEVATAVVEGIRAESFLILPHPQVADYFRNKANDYDRWIDGMQRLNRTMTGSDKPS